METKVSRLEQENFMRVLKVVKQFSGVGSFAVKGEEPVIEGNYLATEMSSSGPQYFSACLSSLVMTAM